MGISVTCYFDVDDGSLGSGSWNYDGYIKRITWLRKYCVHNYYTMIFCSSIYFEDATDAAKFKLMFNCRVAYMPLEYFMDRNHFDSRL